MSLINVFSSIKLFNSTQIALSRVTSLITTRLASKKAGGSSQNRKKKAKPKHRGIKFQDGHYVEKGSMLLTQNKLRCHPGQNVGLGKNGTLVALTSGQVIVTCEKVDLNMDHAWNRMFYQGRVLDNVYKKYFHVLPPEPHYRFRKIE